MSAAPERQLADRLATSLLPRWLGAAATAVGLYLPGFLILGFVYDWDFVVGTGDPSSPDAEPDAMFLSMLLVAIGVVWIGLGALRSAPVALLRLADRGALVVPDDESVATDPDEVQSTTDLDLAPLRRAVAFVERDHSRRSTHACLVGGAVASFLALWYEAWRRTSSANPVWVGSYADEFDWPSAIAIVAWIPVAGILLALFARLFVMVRMTNRVAYGDGLHVLVGHPDRAAGLEPLGNQLLRGLLIGAAPATWASVWAMILAADDLSSELAALSDRWLDILRFFVVPVFALLMYPVAVRPILHVRSRIREANRELYSSVDRLSRTIHQEASAAVAHADVQRFADGQKRVESLQKLYQALFPLPTWPFDRAGVVKFVGAVAPSILAVSGLGDALVEIIGAGLGAAT